jgi:hypothetical protein
MKSKFLIHITISLLLFTSGCSKSDLFDFAVIRPDSVDSNPMTTFNFEKVIPAISNTYDSTSVIDLNVVVYKINKGIIIDSLSFIYNYPDTLITHEPINFSPENGNIFKIVCNSTNLPTLTAETYFPNQPVIENNKIIIDSKKVAFSIIADSTAYLYDIYIFDKSNQYYERVLRSKNGNTNIEIATNSTVTSEAVLVVYAYDKNLSEYLTATNLFYKFNTYRPPFSTVHNGFGCFGSLNILSKKIN